MSIITRLKNVWNLFANKDPTSEYVNDYYGNITTYRPDRVKLTRGNERSIVTAIYNRIAVDVAAINIEHVRLDDNDRFLENIESGLNGCLTLEANKDQTSRAFIQDVVLSMFDEGCIAVVPIDTDQDILSGTFDIYSMRTGKIIEWKPDKVKVRVYNDRTGFYEEVYVMKDSVAILENPFYAVMNEPNSTLQRLIRKLSLMDKSDEHVGARKLDIILQLPYTLKTEARRQQAKERVKAIEDQLDGSPLGIAYADATEKITQLNRPVENQLQSEVEYLTSMLFSQLGLTKEVFEGTADEQVMLNYQNRTLEPILSAICDEFKRKFLTKTARTQKQSIVFFREPFKLVPVNNLAEIADKVTRNEIMTSNEVRQIMGMKPASDPEADRLKNSNISESKDQANYDIDGNFLNDGKIMEER